MRKKIGTVFIIFLIMIVISHVVIYVVNNHIAKGMEKSMS